MRKASVLLISAFVQGAMAAKIFTDKKSKAN
jgi:hypothetical protein